MAKSKRQQLKNLGNKNRYQAWSIKIYGLIQLILAIVVAEMNNIFKHEIPKIVLMKQVYGSAED